MPMEWHSQQQTLDHAAKSNIKSEIKHQIGNKKSNKIEKVKRKNQTNKK